MAVEKVKEYLRTYHMEERILEFDVSSATAELAAQAVGCEPEYARLQCKKVSTLILTNR